MRSPRLSPCVLELLGPAASDVGFRLKNYGSLAVDQYPVLEVGGDGAGEDDALDVAADTDQVGDLVGVADPDHVLVDDRAGVELGGHVVGGRADQLDAALVGASVGVGADERRQEAVVDVDRGRADGGEEAGERICM